VNVEVTSQPAPAQGAANPPCERSRVAIRWHEGVTLRTSPARVSTKCR